MKKEIISYIKTLSNKEKIQKLLIETVGKILLKQNNVEEYIKENEKKIIHIRDWMSSVFENNEDLKKPRVLTIEALSNAADKYFEKKNNKLQTIELDENHEKLIDDLSDYYIVQMLTPEALDNESKQMQHCIGHGYYDETLKDDKYLYLSLRDKHNKAHITLEILNKRILQLQGKQNKIPETKYLQKILPWLIEKKYEIDLMQYKMIKNISDNKIYSVYEMPDNCIIDGNLNLERINIKKLPNNLKINGDLILPINDFVIPKDIIIKGNICINQNFIKTEVKQELLSDIFNKKNDTTNFELILNIHNNISKINLGILGLVLNENDNKIYYISKMPENCKINTNGTPFDIVSFLFLETINNIPNNLTVDGNFNLSYCVDLKELPKGMIINGDLNLSNTEIKNIPLDLKVSGSINFQNSKIEKLPDNLIVDGNLNLCGCQYIDELPKGLIVNGNVNARHTKIKKLPDNLIVNGTLDLRDSEIFELPNNLKVKNLYLGYKNYDIKIPDDINIEKEFFIFTKNVKKLPDNFKCDTIYINESQISLIKENLNIENIIVRSDNKNEITYSKKQFLKIFKEQNGWASNIKKLGYKND